MRAPSEKKKTSQGVVALALYTPEKNRENMVNG
jgi:hypothetical protein